MKTTAASPPNQKVVASAEDRERHQAAAHPLAKVQVAWAVAAATGPIMTIVGHHITVEAQTHHPVLVVGAAVVTNPPIQVPISKMSESAAVSQAAGAVAEVVVPKGTRFQAAVQAEHGAIEVVAAVAWIAAWHQDLKGNEIATTVVKRITWPEIAIIHQVQAVASLKELVEVAEAAVAAWTHPEDQ